MLAHAAIKGARRESTYEYNVIVVSVKEFLIEVQKQMARIHYSVKA